MVWFSAALLLAGMDLFEAGKGGYMTYRIPGMVTLGDGTVLAYAEARKDGAGDWADIDIVMRRSKDGGERWTEPVVLADSGTQTVNNVVAIAGKGKREVHLIYCVDYARAFYRRSTDSGQTFTAPVEITAAFEAQRGKYNWNVIATGPGHGVRLKSGRLLVPTWLSTGGKAHRPSVVSTLYSDDDGQSWKTGEIILGALVNPSETAAVELKDGRVMMNIRSESDALRRAVVYSPDGVSGWTAPGFVPELKEPVCMASLLRHPRGLLVFANPANTDAEAPTKRGRSSQRRNLTLHVSRDEGKTWQNLQVIDPDISAYSDLAADRKGNLLVLYEKGGRNGNMYFTQALRLEKFPAKLFAR
jgi:sialidase-1